MKITAHGYFTPSRRMEKSAVAFVRKYAPRILGEHAKKVKHIKIIFHKHPISWTEGFTWLYKRGVATLIVSGRYRGFYRSKWMLAHDLVHVTQMIEGRLKQTSTHIIDYKKPKGRKFSRWQWAFKNRKGKWCWKNLENQRLQKCTDWEEEVHTKLKKFLWGTGITRRAWDE